MHRKPNLRLFLWTILALVPAALAVHVVHGYQVRHHALTLLERGDQAQAQEQTEQALGYYTRYLAFAPKDAEAREKYARLLDRVGGPLDRPRVVLLVQE